MNQDEIRKRLLNLDTACICDAGKALQRKLRVMESYMRPIHQGIKLVGAAHTVRCHDDFLTVIKALRDAEPGEVIVIDSQDSRKALTGELFPTEALRKGLAGIVNDGPCRDTSVVRNMKIPYYAKTICCSPGTANKLFETQIPVNCGGVTVHPGDLLFGDEDGVIVTDVNELSLLIPVAESIQQTEGRLLNQMQQGVSLFAMLNFDEHCAAIRAGKKSQLEFQV